MDYRGQKLCEWIYSILLIACGAISWIVGYIKNDFYVAVYGWMIGLALALVICIPDWPWFNRHPVKWLEEIPDYPEETSRDKTEKVKSKKRKD